MCCCRPPQRQVETLNQRIKHHSGPRSNSDSQMMTPTVRLVLISARVSVVTPPITLLPQWLFSTLPTLRFVFPIRVCLLPPWGRTPALLSRSFKYSASLPVFRRLHLLFIFHFLGQAVTGVSPPAAASSLVSVHLIRVTLNTPRHTTPGCEWWSSRKRAVIVGMCARQPLD